MVVAHKIGRDHAKMAYDEVRLRSAKWFKTEQERECFLAGYVGELGRLAKDS